MDSIEQILHRLDDAVRSRAKNTYQAFEWAQFDKTLGGWEYWAVPKITEWANASIFDDFLRLDELSQVRLVNLSFIHPIFSQALQPLIKPLWEPQYLSIVVRMLTYVDETRKSIGVHFAQHAQAIDIPIVAQAIKILPNGFARLTHKSDLDAMHAHIRNGTASPTDAVVLMLTSHHTLDDIKTLAEIYGPCSNIPVDWHNVLNKLTHHFYLYKQAWSIAPKTEQLALQMVTDFPAYDGWDGEDEWEPLLMRNVFALVHWDSTKIHRVFEQRSAAVDLRYLGRVLLELHEALDGQYAPLLDVYWTTLPFPNPTQKMQEAIDQAKNRAQRATLLEHAREPAGTVHKKKM